MTTQTTDKVQRWANDPILLLVSRWVAIGGIPAMLSFGWAALTWGADIESRMAALEADLRSGLNVAREERMMIDERLRQREANAFTEDDASVWLRSVQRELDQMNRNYEGLRDDVRSLSRDDT